ncbi:MAG: YihY/virulence factor BrkB family protein [Lachnospiraceae bacterium]|nr:YihY/virulence factor BrkB family protein [Lachnospiraceae bacterium]
MKYIKQIYKHITNFTRQLTLDHVNAYAAQASFFTIIAIFPLLMLLLTIIRYTPVTEQDLIKSALAIMPNTLDPLIEQIISEMYSQANFAIISITAILALWSASKGILAIIRGLNSVFGIDENRNYFHLRLVASFYTIMLLILIILSLGFMVFGNSLLRLFSKNAPILYELVELIISLRGIYIPIIFTIAFVYLYRIVPNKGYTFFDHLPGALFSSFGWILFSYGYSIYVDNFAGSTYIYGSLTTVVLLMLWVYICMYILFIGAEINIQFKEYFRKTRRKIKNATKNE